jgi:hypothetical protein
MSHSEESAPITNNVFFTGISRGRLQLKRMVPVQYPQIRDLHTILADKTPNRIIPEAEKKVIERIHFSINSSQYQSVQDLQTYLKTLDLEVPIGIFMVSSPNNPSSESSS